MDTITKNTDNDGYEQLSMDSIRMALDAIEAEIDSVGLNREDDLVLKPDPEYAAKAEEARSAAAADEDMRIYDSSRCDEPAPEVEELSADEPAKGPGMIDLDIAGLAAEIISMEEPSFKEDESEETPAVEEAPVAEETPAADDAPEAEEAEEASEEVEEDDAAPEDGTDADTDEEPSEEFEEVSEISDEADEPEKKSRAKRSSGARGISAPKLPRAASAGAHAASAGRRIAPAPKTVGKRGISTASVSYAAKKDYDASEGSAENASAKPAKQANRSFRELVVRPVIGVLSVIGMKIGESKSFFAAREYNDDSDLGSEVPLTHAAKFYELRVSSLRARMKLSFIFTLILIYISFGFPVFGALKYLTVSSAVCVILLLTVMILGLDVITSGLTAIGDKRLNANSLVALSCILSVLDGIITACGVPASGLPFCAVSALTMSLTLLGSVLNCEADKNIFRISNSVKRRFTLMADADINDTGITVLKSQCEPNGIVRRTEEAGPDEMAFGAMAPYFIPAVLLLTLIASITSKNWSGFAHTLSGIFVFAAPSAILFSFALPFSVSSEALADRGACIAGWAGLYDMGKSRDIIVTDRDLFSRNDVSVKQPRILAGFDSKEVISIAASVMHASGCAMSHAFDGLLHQVGGRLLQVDDFKCHESGGLVAIIEGKNVLCGPSAFMQLMGIRLTEKVSRSNCVYLAVDGSINAIFEMQYNPSEDVRNSLMDILETGRNPLFAVRDFNINPTMLSDKFDIYTDGFDFPSFSRRYAISAAEPTESSRPAAVMSQNGFGAFVKLADHGARLYRIVQISNAVSVASAIIGMLIMFILSAGGHSFGVTGVLIYMLAVLLPEIILSLTFKAE